MLYFFKAFGTLFKGSFHILMSDLSENPNFFLGMQ